MDSIVENLKKLGYVDDVEDKSDEGIRRAKVN